MLYKFIQSIDTKLKFPTVSAHCDIPCKIYDPIVAQISALTMIRMVDLIEELESSNAEKNSNYFSTLARFVAQKEEHGIKLKQEIQTIWGDYITRCSSFCSMLILLSIFYFDKIKFTFKINVLIFIATKYRCFQAQL